MLKSKKGEANVGIIIILLMGIIVGLVLLNAIFNGQASMTNKVTSTNEVVSVASAKIGVTNNFNSTIKLPAVSNAYAVTDWQYKSCPLTNVVVTNASGTALTVTTDYTFNTTTGVMSIVNTTTTYNAFLGNNNSLVDYTYCADGYVKDGSSRSIAGLIGLFGALALVAFVIGYGIKEWID